MLQLYDEKIFSFSQVKKESEDEETEEATPRSIPNSIRYWDRAVFHSHIIKKIFRGEILNRK